MVRHYHISLYIHMKKKGLQRAPLYFEQFQICSQCCRPSATSLSSAKGTNCKPIRSLAQLVSTFSGRTCTRVIMCWRHRAIYIALWLTHTIGLVLGKLKCWTKHKIWYYDLAFGWHNMILFSSKQLKPDMNSILKFRTRQYYSGYLVTFWWGINNCWHSWQGPAIRVGWKSQIMGPAFESI